MAIRYLVLLTLAIGSPIAAQQPQESPETALLAALADARRLPADTAFRTRYLSLYNLPEARRADMVKAVGFWVNSLSREPDIVVPRVVGPTLLAVDIADYGWAAATWEKLADQEPYFHVQTEVVVPAVTKTDQYGRQYTDQAARKVRQAAGAPWIEAGQYVELAKLTNSVTPIVRADWWIVQTGQQTDRVAGYYDWLQLGKKEADFQKLIGANAEEAKRLKKEIAGIVAKSIVTLNNRSMIRQPTLTGAYWFTQDFKASTDRKNTVRLLDGLTEPPHGDASEQYGSLPNGLFALWLQNDKGERQDTAPDSIASDGKAPGTDRRVHVGVSCVRCHVEGIRPIDDWARKVFRAPLKLGSTDYERLKRLRQLYLSNLPRQVKNDQDAYAEALKAANGLTPGENAATFGRVWEDYTETELQIEDVARELGVAVDEITAALKAVAARNELDFALVGLLQDPPVPIRREHWEEIYQTAQKTLMERKK